MAEVAEARDGIPLAYRLGVLAVFNNSQQRLLSENRLASNTSAFYKEQASRTNQDISSNDFMRPSYHPYTDAARFGKILEHTAKFANRWRSTPVAILSIGITETRLKHLVIPAGDKGLCLSEPRIYQTDNLPKVCTDSPQIRGLKLSPHGSRTEYGASLEFPAIRQLLGNHWPGKLLIGKEASKFTNGYYKKLKKNPKLISVW